MEFRKDDAKFKLAFGKKKIYVYNRKTGEQVDTVYLDEKIKEEYEFRAECIQWCIDNYTDMIAYENMKD